MILSEQNDLISVIVPVYKVELYLDRCVQSIVDQTYQNLEIILVDDGSPDNCPAMCDAWAKRDSRIRVIHKTNGGLSDARNAGMAAATGAYIAFVDSDDRIALEMYERLYGWLKTTDSDIASCGALRVWEDTGAIVPMIVSNRDHILDKIEAMQALIQSTYLIQTVWNKLYRAELAKGILFEKGKLHEDEFWSWQVISKANRVATLEESFYYYLQRSDSIMGGGYTGNQMQMAEAKRLRHRYIKEQMPQLNDIDSADILYTCHYLGIQVLQNETGDIRKAHLEELKDTARQCPVSRTYMRQLPLIKRARLSLMHRCPVLVCKIDIALGKAIRR